MAFLMHALLSKFLVRRKNPFQKRIGNASRPFPVLLGVVPYKKVAML